jgi:hypothetical protein
MKKKVLVTVFTVFVALPIGARANRAQVDNRTLKERAKQERSVRETQNPKSTTIYSDLSQLVNDSVAVIIGTVQKNTPTLSPDGKGISLDYEVRVEYVYKGRIQPDSTITVSLPGGRVKFDDGSTAEIMTPWLRKMQNGKSYALFLQSGTVKGRFVTTGEAQGLVEIPTDSSDRTVKTSSGIQSHPIRRYNGQDVKTFLRELRQVTGKPLKR